MIRAFMTITLFTALYGCANSNTIGDYISDPFASLNVVKKVQPTPHEIHEKYWHKTKAENTAASYNSYLSDYPSGLHTKYAKDKIADFEFVANLKANQACSLHEDKWIYLSQECLGGFAHGTGKAKTLTGLSFVGKFENGYRVNGEIFANNILMYGGHLKEGRPHGNGVCMNKGEPEECKYYKGKRIDVLFKQRIEFAKQTELLTNQQKLIEAKLASMTTRNPSQPPTANDMVMTAMKKKAAEKAIGYLFDHLF